MARHQRLRIWIRGDDTTLWAECTTNPAGTNPYLIANEATAEEEADFVKGSAAISEVSLQILDKRTVAADQDTGWFTAKLAQNGFNAIIGGLAVWDEEVSTGVWRVLMRGVCGAPALVDDVTYSISIRDIRERERKKKGFRNVTTSTVLPPGTVNGYGLRSDGSWLIPPVTPIAGHWAGNVIYIDDIDSDAVPHALLATERKMRAASASGGVFDKVKVSWRPAAGGSWTHVENIPYEEGFLSEGDIGTASYTPFFFTSSGRTMLGGARTDVEYITRVRMASTNPAELPDEEEDIEFYVSYVGEPSEDYPEHLEGTFGEMLQTVCDLHDIEYDSARMADLVTGTPRGRVRITKVVDDIRAWIEKHLMRPMGLAPTLDEDFTLAPTSANLPDASVSLVAIGSSSIIDGDASWVHSDRRVNVIEFDIIYETWGADPLQENASGDGITEHRRTVPRRHEVAEDPHLEDIAKYDQDTVRQEPSRFDTFIEQNLPAHTNPILEHRRALLFDRYPVGAQVFEALVNGTVGDQLRVGTWASIAIPWLPDYTTLERGTNRIGQCFRRVRVDEKAWRVWLEDGGPNSVPVAMPTLGTVTVNIDSSASIVVTTVPAGTEARVEFAVADSEPAADSGDWQTLDRVDTPTTLTVYNLLEGKTLYVRARGEKEARRPSAWTATIATAIPFRARLLSFFVESNADGTYTAQWTANAHTEGLRIYYVAHARGAEPVLVTFVDVDVDAATHTLPASIATHEVLTIEAEPWTGFDGTNVTGTAGARRRVQIQAVAPPSDLALAFLYTSEVHATNDEGAVALLPSMRVTWTASPDAFLDHYELRYRDYTNPLAPGDWITVANPRKEDTTAIIAGIPFAAIEVGLRAVNTRGAKSVEITDDTFVGIFTIADDTLYNVRQIEGEETVTTVGKIGARVAYIFVYERTVDQDADIDPAPREGDLVEMIDVSTLTPDANGDYTFRVTQRPDVLEVTHLTLEPRREDMRVGPTWHFKVNGPSPAVPTLTLQDVSTAHGHSDVRAVVDDPDVSGAVRLIVAVNHDSEQSGDPDEPDGYIDLADTPGTVERTDVFQLYAGGTAQLFNNIKQPLARPKRIYGKVVEISSGRESAWIWLDLTSAYEDLLDDLGAQGAESVVNQMDYAEEIGLVPIYRPSNLTAIQALPNPRINQRAVAHDTGIRYVYDGDSWEVDEDQTMVEFIPALSSGIIEVDYLAASVGEFINLTVEETLIANDVVVQGTLDAEIARIDTLEADVATIESAYITEAEIETLLVSNTLSIGVFGGIGFAISSGGGTATSLGVFSSSTGGPLMVGVGCDGPMAAAWFEGDVYGTLYGDADGLTAGVWTAIDAAIAASRAAHEALYH